MPLFSVRIVLARPEVEQALRLRLAERERELAELHTRLNRAEYQLGCEVHVSGELMDLCRSHGIETRFSKRGKNPR